MIDGGGGTMIEGGGGTMIEGEGGTMIEGGGGTMIQSTKRRHLPGIECCRHIHHLLSDRITAPMLYTATLLQCNACCAELCLGESKGWGRKCF